MVLFALVAVVFAAEEPEAQDQDAAEQFFYRYGYYPSWYSYGAVRAFPYAGYPYAAYPHAYRAFPTYGYGYGYVY